ncbi:tyrosine-type recombinase/integrase [Deinococcus sp. Marseille-Q6407]|uniref:tyrosine-type recombinase/integrase n=1 Tax=Deinococcus sp. Marseille-Q6407 TaxID=2969223 RepID=UPI0021C122B2|nr:site-specific integrase [Deinococcus sp. Marseille-Q6407]
MTKGGQIPAPGDVPQDERRLKLAQAVRGADLDRVVAMLPDAFRAPQHTVRSTLKWIFEAAERDGINLLDPPEDFQAWLGAPLGETRSGPDTAKPNTVRTRLTLLGAMYRALYDEGLIGRDPLYGFKRPPAQRKLNYLPSREAIERLIAQADDPEMKAALYLITWQAFQTGEVLGLKWSDIDPQRGTILRRRTETHVAPEVLQALQNLADKQGGWLFSKGWVMTIRTDAGFRQALWRTCKLANTDYVPPSHLRQAALRDFGNILSAQDAGYVSPKAYAEALDLARGVLEEQKAYPAAEPNTGAEDS